MSGIMNLHDRYKSLYTIGAGGMGVVYRTWDRLNNTEVALKSITVKDLPPDTDEQLLKLALAHEFKLLAGLRHPNIVEVFDYGFAEEPYFTMTFLTDSKPITEAAQGMEIEEKVNLLIQVCNALHYLHRRGIIHRDIKPSNILVSEARNVRVLNFGLAIESD